jgi:hypothetical protein
MSILSLQSIIQKYGANFGIDTKAAIKDPAKDAGKDSASGAGASAKDSSQTDKGTAKIPTADSLNLSPAAKDFLASHTGALGKFEMPNVLDAFLSAMDGTDQSGSGNGSGNSLLDFLSGPGNANQGGSGSDTGATGFQNPFATDSQNPSQTGNPSMSLLDFL